MGPSFRDAPWREPRTRHGAPGNLGTPGSSPLPPRSGGGGGGGSFHGLPLSFGHRDCRSTPHPRPRERASLASDPATRCARGGRGEEVAYAALVLRWPNMMCLASSSMSALKVNLSFNASARAAAGRAATSSTSRLTLG